MSDFRDRGEIPEAPPAFGVVIDTPDAFAHMRMCQIIGALSIEVNTGMTHSRGSIMNLARDTYGIQKRTKKGVLADMRALYLATYGRECQIGRPR